MKKSILEKYAKLTVKMGVNVQKGQLVFINAKAHTYEFVEEIVKQAYLAKAKDVLVNWTDLVISRLNYQYQDIAALSTIPDWVKAKYDYLTSSNYCVINVLSDDPDLLNGIPQEKIIAALKANEPVLRKYRYNTMNAFVQWTIVAYPNQVWANKVFPNLKPKEAYKKLEDAIISTSRLIGNPIANWKAHNANLLKRADWLNNLNLDYLEYSSSNGTNLKVYLADEHVWLAGAEKTPKKVWFNPNIPSEECFTMPHNKKTTGKVVSTKPLSYSGQLIEDFYLVFKEGKVVEFGAKSGQDALASMLAMDEGATSIGEVALVPYHSPISESGILFYQTLFDENASCHLALGRAYPNTVINGEHMEESKLISKGCNVSMIHVDFMVGASDTNITGYTKEGKSVAIFVNGDWAN